MYKIFFQDRFVVLSESQPTGEARPGQEFYAYTTISELKQRIDSFSADTDCTSLFIYHPDLDILQDSFRSCFKYLKAGGGLVYNQKGEFLAIYRNGVWDLPKGKMEKGEDFEQTALREVEEETGLGELEARGLLLSTFHTYPHRGQMVLKETRWYEMLWKGDGIPKLEAEEGISDYRWVKAGEAGFISENSYASILDVLRISDISS